MKILTTTGSTSVEEKIENPITDLILVTTGTDVDLSDVLVNAWLNRGTGSNKRLLTNFPLEAAAVISVLGKGYNKNIMDVATDAKVETAVRTIKLADGVIQLKDGEHIRIQLSGLTSGDTTVVYGNEYGIATSSTEMYDILDVDSAANGKRFNVKEYDYVCLDASKITEVRGTLSNGKTFTEPIAQIQAQQNFFNDKNLVKVLSTGEVNETEYLNYVMFPLDRSEDVTVESIDIDSNASTDLFVVWNEEIDEDDNERFIKSTETMGLNPIVRRSFIEQFSKRSI
jgi:hypothetical protein